MANEMTLKEKAWRLVKVEGQWADDTGRKTYAYDVAQAYLAQEEEIERLKREINELKFQVKLREDGNHSLYRSRAADREKLAMTLGRKAIKNETSYENLYF